MLEWVLRGLRKRRITTRYPRHSEPAPAGFVGRVDVLHDAGASADLARVCPSGAITVDEAARVRLHRGRCILCGECVRAVPQRFAFVSEYETAARSRSALVTGDDEPDDLEQSRETLADRAGALRRSIHVRHIDCGSDGSEEWEIQALWNPYYDIQRLGFFLTNAPRHADVLLVTGPVTAPMRAPLQRTWQVMPEPKALVAVGTDACGGGLHGHGGSELTAGGVDRVLPVDVYVPGAPPAPIAIMHGLLLATGLLSAEVDAA
jgi:Ni,Fe-hydrogenase III small subunit/ferredoxin